MRDYKVGILLFFVFSVFHVHAGEPEDRVFKFSLDSARKSEINGDYKRALKWGHKALRLAKTDKHRGHTMDAEYTLGRIYFYSIDYAKSATHHFAALKLAEELKDNKMQGDCLNAIGMLYYARIELDKAEEYFRKSMKISQRMPTTSLHASNLSYLAGVFYNQNKFDSASLYYAACEKIYLHLKDSSNLVLNQQNQASVLGKLGRVEEGIKLLQESIQLCEAMNSPQDVGYGYFLMACIYEENKDYKNAETYFKKGLQQATLVNDYVFMSNNSLGLSNVQYAMSDYKNALENYRQYVIFKDSTFNEEQTKEITSREVAFTLEKKQLAENIKRNEAIKRQRIYTYAGIGGCILMLLLAMVLFRSNRHKQKTNLLITEQKKQVELQKAQVEEQKFMLEARNKEVFDSITYAKRLQQAILSTPEEIKKALPKSFLHYQPKDIVAGDFYFFETKGDLIFIAAADCTGHGVPGAMVSVVCCNALERCVKEFNLTDPGNILDKTCELVLDTFRKSGDTINDGMDISLCVLQMTNDQCLMRWAGANNPLWIYDSATDSIVERTPDKQPVGLYDNPKPFTTHAVTLNPNDIIYLFTDGYADQFGGHQGKKMKSGNLKKYLYFIRFKPMDEQHRYLAETFDQWRGTLEQIDDVCLIGIRI